jgi:formylglycine-generating enzyme required for sulfatase activity
MNATGGRSLNQPAGKHRKGLRPFFKGGLAFVVVGLVVSYWLSPKREPPPPTVKLAPRDRSLAVSIVEGSPTRINADELPRAGQERNDNTLEMAFCWCPPGEFSMGGGAKGPRGRYLDAEPASASIGRGFWMGKFEVTQAQWQKVVGRTVLEQRSMDPKQPRPLGDNSKRDHAGMGPDYPIYFTSYVEAQQFCDKLTEDEHRSERLESGWVYTLPTEAQWEFACRAGTTTATALGNRLGSAQANFDGTAPFNNAPKGPFPHVTKPVGSYAANGWGLHDMHGNVWEWCRDVSRTSFRVRTDPFQNPASLDRAARGGCWYEPGHRCLSTSSIPLPVWARGSGLGFRVALVSTEP